MALRYFTTAALANCHQLSILNQDKFIFSTALEGRSPVGLEGFFVSGLTKQKSRCQLTWTFIKELWNRICFQVYSSCRQNSIQCVCRTEFPVSLLAKRQMPVFVLAHVPSQALHVVPSSDSRSSIFHALSLSESSFYYF